MTHPTAEWHAKAEGASMSNEAKTSMAALRLAMPPVAQQTLQFPVHDVQDFAFQGNGFLLEFLANYRPD